MAVFIVAEIGINHNGDVNIAKKLIDVASFAGCDAVKFQKRTPEICVPEEQRNMVRDTPWGAMTYMEYRQKLEFGANEYDEIDSYCKVKNIEWFASPWDVISHRFLKQYNLRYNKIPSSQLTNLPLLESVSSENKYTFVSTGMSTLEEIEDAVTLFRKYECPFELMHCNSSYPMKNNEANLNCINSLRDYFKCDVGYSGHETGLQISIAAVAFGITSLERHITLDRSSYGSDQAASIEPQGLIRLVRDVRIIEQALGDSVKQVFDSEKPALKKLRYYCNTRV